MMLKSMVMSMLLMLCLTFYGQAAEKTDVDRHNDVAERGARVMPFNLEQTIHVFTKTATGGIQQILVKEKSDTEQVELIRAHLSEIARKFSQGDFSEPAKIHGAGMPGLAELRNAKPGQVEVAYKELPNGAQIDYSTDETDLVTAIHRWFDAQLKDHAVHATPGHIHNFMHEK